MVLNLLFNTMEQFLQKKDRQTIDRFQDKESNDARFFVGNPQTGGYGITLTLCQVPLFIILMVMI
jgi:SNF2 family DNA or RNA helicase